MCVAIPPYVVALTGGIASGKSAAATCFGGLGVAVHDADEAARAVVRRGQAAYAAIVDAFGPAVLGTDGELDRRVLRERVFNSAAQRQRLESIVHPEVQRWLRRRVEGDRGEYCLLAIPLLAETWPQYAWVDRVAVVDVPAELQRERLLRRDGISPALADAMLAAQASRAQRLAIAQDVIDNAGTLAQLEAQVRALDVRYRHLAALKRGGG